MRKLINTFVIAMATVMSLSTMAQQPDLQYFREPGQEGLLQFEAPKDDGGDFDGVEVRVGGDFAIQFQALSQSSDMVGDTLVELGSNFNLPTANLNLDIQLHDGVRLHMRTYLSSRHHTEAWVKGGYVQIDRLDFIKEGFLEGVMEYLRFRFGMNDINYGDVHFRRSDNARAIYNPFVGNYIIDAFTTEPFGEVTVLANGFIGVLGLTNGRLNQSVTSGDKGMVIYGKLGYDKQINDDFRLRLTGSFYNSSSGSTRDYLYGGDRAGGRYYGVLEFVNAGGSDFNPRLNPRFGSQMAIMVNPFIKFKGLEFFGTFETTSNNDDAVGGSFTQLGAELLYRFGGSQQFYIGGRYNSVTGNMSEGAESIEISRINVGGGWFLTPNVLTKVEYVSNTYGGNGYQGTMYQGAEFSGAVIEAVIGF